MQISAADSSFEVISWFLNQAKKDDVFLDYRKLQHLLFLSQLHYQASFPDSTLMPCVFAYGRNGYEEPSFAGIYSAGILPQVSIRLSYTTIQFLEKVWHIYSAMNASQLETLIRHRIGTPERKGQEKIIPDFKTLVEKFKSSSKMNKSSVTTEKNNSVNTTKKVMLSQNGPVMVSAWKPRKISETVSSSLG
ncbi:MAG: hypothetical protein IJX20_04885 [Alphaproteobacteria bacterium]|nr:hypothetical protein [Alphaproteobacteria bacterium]